MAGPGLEESAVQAQMAAAVRDALGQLDAPYRQVLEARFFEGRSAADIARSEGCPAGTVRWRVQEGLRRMRSKLDARFERRDAWRGGMAAFAGVRLPEASASAGGNAMTNTTMFKWLTAGVLAAGGGAGAYLLSGAEEPHTVAPESAAEPQLLAASRVATPRPAATAIRRAPTLAGGGGGPLRPSEPKLPTQEGDDEPECGGGCEGPEPHFPAISECAAEFPVGAHGRLDITLSLSEVDARGQVRVDEVRMKDEGQSNPQLVACIDDGLQGESVEMPGMFEGPKELRISLIGDGDVAQEYQHENDADPDLPTPREYGVEHGLPTRSEGSSPTRNVVECGEFDCPFCDKTRPTIEQLLDEHPDVSVTWMHNPMPFHPGAMVAAQAAVAAHEQGKFWEMHELLFDEQGRRSEDDMVAFAQVLELDLDRFRADMSSEETRAEIEAQKEICLLSGGKGTPSFFVEDELLLGAQPYARFDEALN